MLQRVANVIVGGTILTIAGYTLAAHLTGGEPLQVLVLLLGAVLLSGAAACLWAGLVVERADEDGPPLLPTAGETAAWRLREMKRVGASRPPGVRMRRPMGAPLYASTRA